MCLNDRSNLLVVEVLDMVTGIWSTAAPVPTPRLEYRCAVVGSLLYVVGGFDGNR